jgi:hypothetical protein
LRSAHANTEGKGQQHTRYPQHPDVEVQTVNLFLAWETKPEPLNFRSTHSAKVPLNHLLTPTIFRGFEGQNFPFLLGMAVLAGLSKAFTDAGFTSKIGKIRVRA